MKSTIVILVIFIMLATINVCAYLSDFSNNPNEKYEKCHGKHTTKGCKIVKEGYWDLIDCNGYQAYYLPQICHEYSEDKKSQYIYIDGNLYVWAYEIHNDEVMSDFPCARDYSCDNSCFRDLIIKYRKEYDFEKGERYCNDNYCGLKPYIEDNCQCPPAPLVTPIKCKKYKWIVHGIKG